jgi:hypothetical protein
MWKDVYEGLIFYYVYVYMKYEVENAYAISVT